MSINFEERLRADMGHVEVHPRPGLAREAHRRYRKTRRRTALAVAVAGATAGFALTAGSAGTAPIETTAYVVNRVSSALASTDLIGYSTARWTGPGLPAAISGPTDAWQFGERSRYLHETAAGQPSFDVSFRPEDRALVLTRVNFQSRTWTSVTLGPKALTFFEGTEGNSLCGGGLPLLGVPHFGVDVNTAADWRQAIETGLNCGAFTVAGRQWVDGVDAIKLTGHKTAGDATIWVDPRSYLPVRLVTRMVGNVAGAKPVSLTRTIDFRWLPPTRANLAELTAPIPAGFHKVNPQK
jgi:hypothetical protein